MPLLVSSEKMIASLYAAVRTLLDGAVARTGDDRADERRRPGGGGGRQDRKIGEDVKKRVRNLCNERTSSWGATIAPLGRLISDRAGRRSRLWPARTRQDPRSKKGNHPTDALFFLESSLFCETLHPLPFPWLVASACDRHKHTNTSILIYTKPEKKHKRIAKRCSASSAASIHFFSDAVSKLLLCLPPSPAPPAQRHSSAAVR